VAQRRSNDEFLSPISGNLRPIALAGHCHLSPTGLEAIIWHQNHCAVNPLVGFRISLYCVRLWYELPCIRYRIEGMLTCKK